MISFDGEFEREADDVERDQTSVSCSKGMTKSSDCEGDDPKGWAIRYSVISSDGELKREAGGVVFYRSSVSSRKCKTKSFDCDYDEPKG